jgi:hypothetical protein
MTLQTFSASLQQDEPPGGVSTLLQALWYDGKNDWHRAHDIAQEIKSPEGSWIHAYLHRKEGDAGNAGYWYHRAGKPVPDISLEEEWKQIATALLQS